MQVIQDFAANKQSTKMLNSNSTAVMLSLASKSNISQTFINLSIVSNLYTSTTHLKSLRQANSYLTITLCQNSMQLG